MGKQGAESVEMFPACFGSHRRVGAMSVCQKQRSSTLPRRSTGWHLEWRLARRRLLLSNGRSNKVQPCIHRALWRELTQTCYLMTVPSFLPSCHRDIFHSTSPTGDSCFVLAQPKPMFIYTYKDLSRDYYSTTSTLECACPSSGFSRGSSPATEYPRAILSSRR